MTFDASEELRNLTRNDASANRPTKTIFGGGAKRGNLHERSKQNQATISGHG